MSRNPRSRNVIPVLPVIGIFMPVMEASGMSDRRLRSQATSVRGSTL